MSCPTFTAASCSTAENWKPPKRPVRVEEPSTGSRIRDGPGTAGCVPPRKGGRQKMLCNKENAFVYKHAKKVTDVRRCFREKDQ